MPRGPFSAPIATPTAVTTTVDLFHGTVIADAPITVIGFELYSFETQDANEKVLPIHIVRGVTGGGTGGTALTEVNFNDAGGASPTCAWLGLNTTVSTGGATMASLGWNCRIPLYYFWVPEMRPSVDSTQDPFAIRLQAAPADSVTMAGTIYWFEH